MNKIINIYNNEVSTNEIINMLLSIKESNDYIHQEYLANQAALDTVLDMMHGIDSFNYKPCNQNCIEENNSPYDYEILKNSYLPSEHNVIEEPIKKVQKPYQSVY